MLAKLLRDAAKPVPGLGVLTGRIMPLSLDFEHIDRDLGLDKPLPAVDMKSVMAAIARAERAAAIKAAKRAAWRAARRGKRGIHR